MTAQMSLPELGENLDSAEVVAVLIDVGDTVSLEQPVLEIETDKAALEVPSAVAGRVTAVHVAAGAVVQVGQALFDVDPVGSPEAAAPAGEPPTPPAPGPSAFADGAGAPESSDSVPAPTVPAPAVPEPTEPTGSAGGRGGGLVPASPATRRFAREIGVAIASVRGTGPRGRISVEDVKRHARSAGPPAREVPSAVPGAAGASVRREPLSRVRALTAERLARAWREIPHVTNHDRADITELEELRRLHAGQVEAAGGKLTVTAILTRVVASALRRYPKVNATIDLEQSEILYRDEVHVGIAVNTDRGLLVPVIRDADRKNVRELAIELTDLADRARSKKLRPEEMRGAGFSISNLGGIGGTGFTPIVSWPEVAILGVSRASVEPVWRTSPDGALAVHQQRGGFVPRLLLPLSLSYDHRLIDGADAARFLRWVARALEQPFLLALEG